MVSKFQLLKSALFAGLVLTLVGVLAANVNAAGVVGYRNDTNQVVVVQTVMIVNNVTRRGKPQTLFPGEVALDGFIGQGGRRVLIYDPKKPSTPLFKDEVNAKEDTVFSIQTDTTIMVKGQPPSPPKVKLVPIPLANLTKSPNQPSGMTQPGQKSGSNTTQPKKP
jgi:hypothetical protein